MKKIGPPKETIINKGLISWAFDLEPRAKEGSWRGLGQGLARGGWGGGCEKGETKRANSREAQREVVRRWLVGEMRCGERRNGLTNVLGLHRVEGGQAWVEDKPGVVWYGMVWYGKVWYGMVR